MKKIILIEELPNVDKTYLIGKIKGKQTQGPSKIILVKHDSEILNVRKHFIRNNFVKEINGKYVD